MGGLGEAHGREERRLVGDIETMTKWEETEIKSRTTVRTRRPLEKARKKQVKRMK